MNGLHILESYIFKFFAEQEIPVKTAVKEKNVFWTSISKEGYWRHHNQVWNTLWYPVPDHTKNYQEFNSEQESSRDEVITILLQKNP